MWPVSSSSSSSAAATRPCTSPPRCTAASQLSPPPPFGDIRWSAKEEGGALESQMNETFFFRFQNGRPALTCCHSATVHLNELQSTFNELFFGGAEGQRLTRRVMASAAIFCRKLGIFFFFLETKSGDPSKAARGGRWVAGRE